MGTDAGEALWGSLEDGVELTITSKGVYCSRLRSNGSWWRATDDFWWSTAASSWDLAGS